MPARTSASVVSLAVGTCLVTALAAPASLAAPHAGSVRTGGEASSDDGAAAVRADQLILGLNSRNAGAVMLDSLGERALQRLDIDASVESVRKISPDTAVLSLSEQLPGEQVAQLSDLLSDARVVESASPDREVYPAEMSVADPLEDVQWGLWQGPPAGAGVSAAVLPAWRHSRGAGVTVAVIDSGNLPHPDLNENVVPGYDFRDDAGVFGDGDGWDPDPTDTGFVRHGIHVAGIIGAVSGNGIGISGVAPEASIQHVRILGRTSSVDSRAGAAQRPASGRESNLIVSIRWASGGAVAGVPLNPTPARVINLSLAVSGPCAPGLQNVINEAVSRGSVVVVSAGNNGAEATTRSGLTACGNVIVAGAHEPTGAPAYFTNWGQAVDISAPGTRIHSTWATGSLQELTASYASQAGTSMSAPFVSGAAALLLAARPDLTPAEVEDLIVESARPFRDSAWTGTYGSGYLDVEAAMTAATGIASDVSAPRSVALERVGNPGGRIRVTWQEPRVGVARRYAIAVSEEGGPFLRKKSALGLATWLNTPSAQTIGVRVCVVDAHSNGACLSPWSEAATLDLIAPVPPA